MQSNSSVGSPSLVPARNDSSFLSPYLAGVLADAQGPVATPPVSSATWQAHGFAVTATGLEAAFDGATNTTLNVQKPVVAVNHVAVNGVLSNDEITLEKEANDLFDALN
jgi:hypothetical protein